MCIRVLRIKAASLLVRTQRFLMPTQFVKDIAFALKASRALGRSCVFSGLLEGVKGGVHLAEVNEGAATIEMEAPVRRYEAARLLVA